MNLVVAGGEIRKRLIPEQLIKGNLGPWGSGSHGRNGTRRRCRALRHEGEDLVRRDVGNERSFEVSVKAALGGVAIRVRVLAQASKVDVEVEGHRSVLDEVRPVAEIADNQHHTEAALSEASGDGRIGRAI